MPIKVQLVALLIMISGFAHAADKKDAFIKAINYCNCRIAKTYCKQYSEMKPESPEKKSYDKISNIFNCSINQSLAFDSINRILKRNNFEEFSKKSSAVFGRIAKEDVEALNNEDVVSKIISGIYESVEFKDFFLQYSEVGYLKESLKNDMSSFLAQTFNTKPITDTSQAPMVLPIEDDQNVNPQYENKESKSYPIWEILPLIALFAGLVYVILKLKILSQTVSSYKEKIDRNAERIIEIEKKIKENPSQSNSSSNNYHELKKYVESSISNIKSDLKNIQSDLENLKMNFLKQSEIPEYPKPISAPVEKPKRVETLYAPIPNKDGSFTAINVTSIENQSSSFYKLTITDNLSQKATFEFLNVERAIKDATSSPELILNPVCRIKNALNQNAKRIRTITPGVVVKHNDKWILEKPADIEYE